jgi:hypothetical protein
MSQRLQRFVASGFDALVFSSKNLVCSFGIFQRLLRLCMGGAFGGEGGGDDFGSEPLDVFGIHIPDHAGCDLERDRSRLCLRIHQPADFGWRYGALLRGNSRGGVGEVRPMILAG